MLERLFRIENLAVIPLLAIVVVVALGARWRDDPRRRRVAHSIDRTVRFALVLLVAAIVLFLLLVNRMAPIGP